MTRSLFFGLFVALLVFSSCAPSRFTRDSGATNVLNMSFSEPGISYTEASAPLEGKSWGGILLGAKSDYAVDVSVINNNNGDNTGYVNTSGGSNAPSALTWVAEFFSIWSTMTAGMLSTGIEPSNRNLVFAGVVSFFASAAINDAIWSGVNRRRVQVQANTQIMELTSDAHFYCMPQSQIEVDHSLFSTSWKGKSSLIAGTIDNLRTVEGESMMSSHYSILQRASDKFRPQKEREQDERGRNMGGENAKGTKPVSIAIQPTQLLGASGEYALSKKELVNFAVISVEEEGKTLSDCIVVIQFVTPNGQTEQKKMRASNDDLFFHAPGNK